MYGPGPYPYPPPQYGYPHQPVVFVPTPPSGRKGKKRHRMGIIEEIERLEDTKKKLEALLKGEKKEEKKDDKKPTGLWKTQFTFGETLLFVFIGALPVTLILHRLVKTAAQVLVLQ